MPFPEERFPHKEPSPALAIIFPASSPPTHTLRHLRLLPSDHHRGADTRAGTVGFAGIILLPGIAEALGKLWRVSCGSVRGGCTVRRVDEPWMIRSSSCGNRQTVQSRGEKQSNVRKAQAHTDTDRQTQTKTQTDNSSPHPSAILCAHTVASLGLGDCLIPSRGHSLIMGNYSNGKTRAICVPVHILMYVRGNISWKSRRRQGLRGRAHGWEPVF